MRRLFLTLVLAFVFVGITNAAVEQGDKEVSIFGTYQNVDEKDDGHEEMTVLAGSLGYFYTDEIQIGVLGMGAWSGDSDLYMVGGNLKYHFMTTSATVPYVGGQLQYAYAESDGDDGDGLIYGPLLGVKFFMDESTSLFVEYQYQLFSGDIDDAIDNINAIMVGISFKF